jgi:hypothetical protein
MANLPLNKKDALRVNRIDTKEFKDLYFYPLPQILIHTAFYIVSKE